MTWRAEVFRFGNLPPQDCLGIVCAKPQWGLCRARQRARYSVKHNGIQTVVVGVVKSMHETAATVTLCDDTKYVLVEIKIFTGLEAQQHSERVEVSLWKPPTATWRLCAPNHNKRSVWQHLGNRDARAEVSPPS